jgi:hypothetical protein
MARASATGERTTVGNEEVITLPGPSDPEAAT